jgi:hypothetical protein
LRFCLFRRLVEGIGTGRKFQDVCFDQENGFVGQGNCFVATLREHIRIPGIPVRGAGSRHEHDFLANASRLSRGKTGFRFLRIMP